METRNDYTGTATATAGGVATLVLNGPSRGYVDIASIAVYVTPSTPLPTCTAYDGPSAVPGRVLAVLRAGDRGTFTSQGDRLNAGQQLTLQWTGCAAGATCQAVLRGTTYAR